jgi:hypothetical protein
MLQVDRGDFVQDGIDCPQDLHRCEGAVIRNSEHDDPLNFRRFLRNCRAGYQPLYAVGDDTHICRFFFAQVGRKFLAQRGNAFTPIIGVKVGIVSGRPQ